MNVKILGALTLIVAAGIFVAVRLLDSSEPAKLAAGEPTPLGHIAPLGPGSEYGTPVPTAPPITLDE